MQTTRTLFIVTEAAGPTFVGAFDSRVEAELTAGETGARVIEAKVPALHGWELFTILGGWEFAAQALTIAAAMAAGSFSNPADAFEQWLKVADLFVHYGARDTEPREASREFFIEFFAAQKVAGR